MTERTIRILARCISTALVAVFLVGWVMSYFVCYEVIATRDLTHSLDLGAQRGSMVLINSTIGSVGRYGTDFVRPGIVFGHSAPGSMRVMPNRMGFRWTSVEFRSRHDDWIIVPYWMVIAVFGLCTWLAWRKPRRHHPAAAFPVSFQNPQT